MKVKEIRSADDRRMEAVWAPAAAADIRGEQKHAERMHAGRNKRMKQKSDGHAWGDTEQRRASSKWEQGRRMQWNLKGDKANRRCGAHKKQKTTAKRTKERARKQREQTKERQAEMSGGKRAAKSVDDRRKR